MIEDTNLPVLRLCSILAQIQRQEQKWLRAMYKAAYFRRIKTAIGRKVNTSLPDGYDKWKSDQRGLAKQLEAARLEALRLNSETIALKSKLRSVLDRSLHSADAHIVFKCGQSDGFRVGNSVNGRFIAATQYADMADQYEAIMTMDRILT